MENIEALIFLELRNLMYHSIDNMAYKKIVLSLFICLTFLSNLLKQIEHASLVLFGNCLQDVDTEQKAVASLCINHISRKKRGVLPLF